MSSNQRSQHAKNKSIEFGENKFQDKLQCILPGLPNLLPRVEHPIPKSQFRFWNTKEINSPGYCEPP